MEMQSPFVHRRCTGTVSFVLLLLRCCAAIWPFDGMSEPGTVEVVRRPVMVVQGMPRVLAGIPVVVEGHFGFDPWEDLHKNLQHVVRRNAEPFLPGMEGAQGALALSGGQVRGAGAPQLEFQLSSLLDIFGGQHQGHVGRAEGSFQVVHDDASRFRITAVLPGYQLNATKLQGKGQPSPLSVKVVGHRSLVVKGMYDLTPESTTGHMIKSWQRVFNLPRGCDTDRVSVTYNNSSGNLTVDMPRRKLTPKEEEEEAEQKMWGGLVGEGTPDLALPPALRAMQAAVPDLVHQFHNTPRQQDAIPGFLSPPRPPSSLDAFLDQMMDQMDQLHPRYHPPHQEPVPEGATVNLVGCFDEAQLAKAELKYYGETNAANFNAMYWHARGDHVPYFAMARHMDPIGHAFTFRNFAHEHEAPRWGVYDGCGSRCSDDDNRWCGCAHQPRDGLPNPECDGDGGVEKRFAVYKIIGSSVSAPRGEGLMAKDEEQDGEEDASAHTARDWNASTEEAAMPRTHGGRPYWQLTDAASDGDSAPSIEIVVPKGTVAEPKGKEVLFFNASSLGAGDGSSAAAGAAAKTSDDASASAGAGGGPASASAAAAPRGSTEAGSPAAKLPPTPLSEADPPPNSAEESEQAAVAAAHVPLGKVSLPVGVNPEHCVHTDKVLEDGGAVLKCELAKQDVREVRINVIGDEL